MVVQPSRNRLNAGKSGSPESPEFVVDKLDKLLTRAINDRVTDLHFRSEEDCVRVLVRKDGILADWESLPLSLAETLFTRLKVLGRMVTYQKRVPQDGAIDPGPYTQDPSIDLRVAIAPVVWGEQAVVRILRGSGGLLPLESLGWPEEGLKRYELLLNQGRGVVLLTGPCGSGKTTTIAASLLKLQQTGPLCICTVEDPVEYRLPGVNQMAVDPAAGVGFAEGVRAWLRHDPDVLVVGEIRDPVAASVAMEAGLVGHLVFSTVHGGSVAAVIVRLLDMGIAPGTLAASLSAIVSQRLVRKLCPECREESTDWPSEIPEGLRPDEFEKCFISKGCPTCDGTGYRGRQGLFELSIVEDDLREAILKRASLKDLKIIAARQAACTLRSHGGRLVEEGITLPHELLRVIGQ